MFQRYAVRANHESREYQVYEVGSGYTVQTFKYKKGETNRGVAHGRANLHRQKLNDADVASYLAQLSANDANDGIE